MGYVSVEQFRQEHNLSRTQAYAMCYIPGFPAFRFGKGKRGTIRIDAEKAQTFILARQLSNPAEMARTGIKLAPRSTTLTVQEQIQAQQQARDQRARREARQAAKHRKEA